MRSFAELLYVLAIVSFSQVHETDAFLSTTRPALTSSSSSSSRSSIQSLPSLASAPSMPFSSSIPSRPTQSIGACANHRLFMTSMEQSDPSSPKSSPVVLSLTAIRASIRATTGLSLTAMRTTLRTLTGVSISGVFKSILGIFPPQIRYFIQPFLVLYYVPLTMLRGAIGTTKTSKADDMKNHEKLVDYWREAVKAAETKIDGWPLHVQEDGSFVQNVDANGASVPSITDAIVESVEIVNESKNEK